MVNILGIILIVLGWLLAYLTHCATAGIMVTAIAMFILINTYVSKRRYIAKLGQIHKEDNE